MVDIPREPPRYRGLRRVLVVMTVVAAFALAYAPLKRAAVDALEAGARVGYGLAAGSPAVGTERLRELGQRKQLDTATPPEQAGAVSRGGLLSPAYNAEGEIRRPDYREWVFVGGAAGLAYGEPAFETQADHPGTFTHVYLHPPAFREYVATGAFPEGTTFALEMRRPTTGVSIAADGWFAGDRLGVHLAIKDTERFGGWRYFNVHGTQVRAARSDSCNTCHARHGEVDNVFVQFYPTLLEARPLPAQGKDRDDEKDG